MPKPRKQAVDVPFSGGINQGSSPKNIRPPGLVDGVNIRYEDEGAIEPRKGTTRVGPAVSGTATTVLNIRDNPVVLSDEGVFKRSPSDSVSTAWRAANGFVHPIKLEQFGLPDFPGEAEWVSIETLNNVVYVTVSVSQSVEDTKQYKAYLLALDSTNLSVITGPIILPAAISYHPQPVVVGTTIAVVGSPDSTATVANTDRDISGVTVTDLTDLTLSSVVTILTVNSGIDPNPLSFEVYSRSTNFTGLILLVRSPIVAYYTVSSALAVTDTVSVETSITGQHNADLKVYDIAVVSDVAYVLRRSALNTEYSLFRYTLTDVGGFTFIASADFGFVDSQEDVHFKIEASSVPETSGTSTAIANEGHLWQLDSGNFKVLLSNADDFIYQLEITSTGTVQSGTKRLVGCSPRIVPRSTGGELYVVGNERGKWREIYIRHDSFTNGGMNIDNSEIEQLGWAIDEAFEFDAFHFAGQFIVDGISPETLYTPVEVPGKPVRTYQWVTGADQGGGNFERDRTFVDMEIITDPRTNFGAAGTADDLVTSSISQNTINEYYQNLQSSPENLPYNLVRAYARIEADINYYTLCKIRGLVAPDGSTVGRASGFGTWENAVGDELNTNLATITIPSANTTTYPGVFSATALSAGLGPPTSPSAHAVGCLKSIVIGSNTIIPTLIPGKQGLRTVLVRVTDPDTQEAQASELLGSEVFSGGFLNFSDANIASEAFVMHAPKCFLLGHTNVLDVDDSETFIGPGTSPGITEYIEPGVSFGVRAALVFKDVNGVEHRSPYWWNQLTRNKTGSDEIVSVGVDYPITNIVPYLSSLELEVHYLVGGTWQGQRLPLLPYGPRNKALTSYFVAKNDFAGDPAGLSLGQLNNEGLLPNPLDSVIDTSSNKDRLFALHYDGRRIFYSKPIVTANNTFAEFTELQVLNTDAEGGRAVAIAAMDDRLIILKESGIQVVPISQGPNAAGVGLDLPPARNVPSKFGCISKSSVVVAAPGVFFQSEGGIYLINRQTQLVNIGETVKNITDANVITSAEVNPVDDEVLFFYGSGNALVFNYSKNAWTRNTSFPSTSGSYDNQILYLLDSTGLVFKYEGTADDSNNFTQTIDTGWVTSQSISGYIRVSEILLRGTHTDGTYIVSTYLDFSDTATDTFTLTLSGDYVTRLKPSAQKCSAFRLRVSGASDSGGHTLESVTLKVLDKGGTARNIQTGVS